MQYCHGGNIAICFVAFNSCISKKKAQLKNTWQFSAWAQQSMFKEHSNLNAKSQEQSDQVILIEVLPVSSCNVSTLTPSLTVLTAALASAHFQSDPHRPCSISFLSKFLSCFPSRPGMTVLAQNTDALPATAELSIIAVPHSDAINTINNLRGKKISNMFKKIRQNTCTYLRAAPLLQELILIVIYIEVFALDFFQRNCCLTHKFIPEKAPAIRWHHCFSSKAIDLTNSNNPRPEVECTCAHC